MKDAPESWSLLQTEAEQIAIPCLFMRGGSSRGGYFLASDLPSDPRERDAVLLAIYGSPDHRQIDGIGGADPLTSKAAVVSLPTRPDADLEYTFYQVGIDRPQVSSGGNCGNMLAAIAAFGVMRGLVAPVYPETSVRIYTTNTKQTVTARIGVTKAGQPSVEGDTVVPGVPGKGARVMIDFGDCAGSVTGKLLPTGNARDKIKLNGRDIEVSFVDAATPFVFVRAADLHLSGPEDVAAMNAHPTLLGDLEEVRGWAATVAGLAETRADALAVTPNLPRVIMVSAAQSYETASGLVQASDMDICVRQLTMQRPHNAIAVTGAVCTAVASQIKGSVVHQLSRPGGSFRRLGHPSGVLTVSAEVSDSRVYSAAIERSARAIMSGEVYVSVRRVRDLLAGVKS